jgi:hypothetical protein
MEKKQRMSNKKAKDLISACIQNGMFHIGVIDEPGPRIDPELQLKDFLKANDKVEAINRTNTSPGPRTMYMTVADRGLAAIYTACNWEGGTPDEPNIVGYANGNFVMVIRASTIKFEEEE